jgi:hypothetical protein
MTAKEAAGMDPMQRKLLEISYEAFENGRLSRYGISIQMRMLNLTNSWDPDEQIAWYSDGRLQWCYDERL